MQRTTPAEQEITVTTDRGAQIPLKVSGYCNQPEISIAQPFTVQGREIWGEVLLHHVSDDRPRGLYLPLAHDPAGKIDVSYEDGIVVRLRPSLPKEGSE